MLGVLADDHDLLDVSEFTDDCIKHRDEFGVDDKHVRPRVVDDESNLGSREPEIDVDTHRIEQRTSVEHLEVLNGVFVEKGNAILVAHTRGLECLGHLA